MKKSFLKNINIKILLISKLGYGIKYLKDVFQRFLINNLCNKKKSYIFALPNGLEEV
jgi:hypothetical protein